MPENPEYSTIDIDAQRVNVNPVMNLPARKNMSYSDDIEVIDLDNPRGQIKPTTWHL